MSIFYLKIKQHVIYKICYNRPAMVIIPGEKVENYNEKGIRKPDKLRLRDSEKI